MLFKNSKKINTEPNSKNHLFSCQILVNLQVLYKALIRSPDFTKSVATSITNSIYFQPMNKHPVHGSVELILPQE